LMFPSAGARQKPRLEGRTMAILERLRQQKEIADKDLRYIMKSLESRVALQSKSLGIGQRQPQQPQVSDVASQLILLIKPVLAATPEELLESSLCLDTIMKIRRLDRHPVTSKLLFSLSTLARIVDAHKSLVPKTVEAPIVAAAVPSLSLPTSPASNPRTESPSPISSPLQTNVSSPRVVVSTRQTESKNDEIPSAIRQPLGELHTETPVGAPNPRPERKSHTSRREARGLSRNQPKSLRSSTKKVMCRICEERYPQSVLKEHTKFCVSAANADMKDQRCYNRIVNVLKLLEEHKRRVAPQGPMKDYYSKIAKLSSDICALPYGSDIEDRKNDCFVMLDQLQQIQAELTYDDVGLVTYLRRLISIIEEKWTNMNEFARLKQESEKDQNQKKSVNIWSLLTLVRPHMDRTTPSAKPDELIVRSKSRVSIDDFEIIKPISSGAYGKVYLARKKKTRDLYAVKVQNKSDLLRKNMVDNVIAERQILSNVKTPFVVKLYYAFQSDKALFLVMEYCPGGDVATLLHNLGAFDMDMARVYAAETVLSLESLHNMSYIHRDLKPDNLLVNAKGHLLLTDFGLSSIGVLEEQSQQSPTATKHADYPSSSLSALKSGDMPRIVGTPDYLAPEMLLGTGHGPEVDWWALGVMIYEFLTGVPPFNAETPEDIFDRILRRDLIWPEEMEPEAQDIINKLLNPDASQRLGHNGAEEVKAHPFFAGINWSTLLQESREDIFVPHLDNPEDTSYHAEHRQAKGGSSMDTSTVFSGQDFQGFEFTNTDSLFERTMSLANGEEEDEENDDDDDDDDGDDRSDRRSSRGSEKANQDSSSSLSSSVPENGFIDAI